jgi:hypothetical protein
MTSNYRVNAYYALKMAHKAVASWQQALEHNQNANDQEGIAFCLKSLKAAQVNLEKTRTDTRDNWTAYL